MATETCESGTENEVLEQLNNQYIQAFLEADVRWYREHLAEDFVCIEADGSVIDKSQFLRDAAMAPDMVAYGLDDVRVRIYETVALIQATGVWRRSDGSQGVSRYVDVYSKVGESWKAVSAQITRVANLA